MFNLSAKTHLSFRISPRLPAGRYLTSVLIALIGLTFTACKQEEEPATLRSGIWRGTLGTKSGREIPFNFEVKETDSAVKYIEIINGDNRLKVDEVVLKGDSLYITMPLFDSEFEAVIAGKTITGRWIRHYASRDMVMPFKATYGTKYRIMESPDRTAFDLSGRWAVNFERNGDSTFAVGEFRQDRNRLTGTFMTASGDYRYLEGVVSGDKFYLSCFDGGFAYLFDADIRNNNTLVNGMFYSGDSGQSTWKARRDSTASLPDPGAMTYLKEGEKKLDFTFPNLEREKVSLSDERFKDKVVIVQFFGTWCPNCMDETAFLSDFYRKYKDRGLEIIGLAYEYTDDLERSRRQVARMRDRFNVEYELLITGYTNKQVEKSMPQLEGFKAFPTTIMIDKKGEVRKIHAGFTGPGTGEHYRNLVDEFTRTVNSLLDE